MNRIWKRGISFFLMLAMLFSTVMPAVSAEQHDVTPAFQDLSSDYWAKDAVERWVRYQVIKGYADGTIRGDQPITRAEFATIMDRVFVFQASTDLQMTDVSEQDWYASAMSKAVEAGFIQLDADQRAFPNAPFSRLETIRALDLLLGIRQTHSSPSETNFTDIQHLDSESIHSIETFTALGFIQGYPDQTFRPHQSITRAEIVTLLDRIIERFIFQEGTVSGAGSTVPGNVFINHPDVVLRNVHVDGNLYLSDGIGEGDVHLDQVSVNGTTFIRGGGAESVVIHDSNLNDVVVSKKHGVVRIFISGNTSLGTLDLLSDAIIEESESGSADRLREIHVSAGAQHIEVNGQVSRLWIEPVSDANETTIVITGEVDELILDRKVNIHLAEDAVVKRLIVHSNAASTRIEGNGKIEQIENEATDVVFNGRLVPTSTASVGSGSSGGSSGSSKPMWTLVWSDEFDGDEIDTSKWSFDIGNGINGWGNNESQYYTDRPENVRVENGALVITGIKENYKGFNYTSAKVKTQGKFSKKYGKFEIRAKFPEGKGYWPAIWMMPEHDVYGTWSASGEIDIMEGWGSKPHLVAGTIHYGGVWPDNTYSGTTYDLGDSTIGEYHVYTLEWEPGEMRWYVDGHLYQVQNDWYSFSPDQPADNIYPAPFDQEFYLILNLAIGGHFDGEPDASTVFPQSMEVDYVRVYELTGREYREPVYPHIPKEDIPVNARKALPDGNLVYNSNFDQDDPDIPNIDGVPNTDYWRLFQGEGGTGQVTIEEINGKNFAKVTLINEGWQPYSVQLLNDISVVKGRFYKLSFDAKSTTKRNIGVKVTGGESRGFTAYSRSHRIPLTDELQHFEIVFQMRQDTDIAARTEFNLGLDKNPVWIGNVRVEEIDNFIIDYDKSKRPLVDGNHLYNGQFDQGEQHGMTFWHFETNHGAHAVAKVTGDDRVLNVSIQNAGNGQKDAVQLIQRGIQLLANQDYVLKMDARSIPVRDIEIEWMSKDGKELYGKQTVVLDSTIKTVEARFTMPPADDPEAQLIISLGGGTGTIQIDNVKLLRESVYFDPDLVFYPLYNGSFEEGFDSWITILDSGGQMTAAVENEEARLTIDSPGNNPWSNMLIQPGMDFKAGTTYILAFDARSTMDRAIEVVLENSSYHRYIDHIVNLENTPQRFSFEFTMPADDIADLKFLLGKVGDAIGSGTHDIFIDQVVLEVKDAPVLRSPRLLADQTLNQLQQPIEITFKDDPDWRDAITEVKLNHMVLPSHQYMLSPGTLLLLPEAFSTAGTYTIRVEAAGYAFTSVKQTILADDNLVINGDFEAGTMDGWQLFTYDGSNATVSIDVYHGSNVMNIHFSHYDGYERWHSQVFQEGISLKDGKTYVLEFDAGATQDKEIVVEIGVNAQPTVHHIQTPVQLTTTMQTFSYEFSVAGGDDPNAKLNFVVGSDNVVFEDFVPHSIYIDNISIKEKS